MSISGNIQPRRTKLIQADNPHAASTDVLYAKDCNTVAFRSAGQRFVFAWPEVFNAYTTGGYPVTGAAYFTYTPMWKITTNNATTCQQERPTTVIASQKDMSIPWISVSQHELLKCQMDVLVSQPQQAVQFRLKQDSGFGSFGSPATGPWSESVSGYFQSPASPGWRRAAHVTGYHMRRVVMSLDITQRGSSGEMGIKIDAQMPDATFYSNQERTCYIRHLLLWEENRADTP